MGQSRAGVAFMIAKMPAIANAASETILGDFGHAHSVQVLSRFASQGTLAATRAKEAFDVADRALWCYPSSV